MVCALRETDAQGAAYTCNEMKIPATICRLQHRNKKTGQVRFFAGIYNTKLVGIPLTRQLKLPKNLLAEKRTFIDPFDDP